MKLNWTYHENTDMFYVFPENEDFGNETEFVTIIGEYKEGTVEELRNLLENSNHFLWNVPDIEERISNDVEQF